MKEELDDGPTVEIRGPRTHNRRRTQTTDVPSMRLDSPATTVQRIAHISDVHLLDGRDAYDFRCRFVSIHRPLDAASRAKKFMSALRAALRSGAHHVVLSGDLTEMGSPTEYEHLGELLHASGIDPDEVTLVPGNHDAYTAEDGWRRALAGPLRAFARGSAEAPGKIVERGGLVLLPIDVTVHQTVARSGGELTAAAIEALEARFSDRALADKAVVVVQHHPPFGNPRSPWHFIDGLAGYARMLTAMVRYPHVQLLHGHSHRIADRAVSLPRAPAPAIGDRLRSVAESVRALPRVFSASATVDDEPGRPRVRLYDLRDGRLEAVGLAA
jgi:3',5'-cyclic AMP phosphodiesterase CpdA